MGKAGHGEGQPWGRLAMGKASHGEGPALAPKGYRPRVLTVADRGGRDSCVAFVNLQIATGKRVKLPCKSHAEPSQFTTQCSR